MGRHVRSDRGTMCGAARCAAPRGATRTAAPNRRAASHAPPPAPPPQLPVITRYYVTLSFLTTAGCALEVRAGSRLRCTLAGHTAAAPAGLAVKACCQGSTRGRASTCDWQA